MYDINLIDETFDKNQSLQYHLLIQIGQGGLSFCILDTVSNKFVVLRHYVNEQLQSADYVQLIAQSDALLQLPYKKVKLMLTDGQNTPIPSAIFDPEAHSFYAQFTLSPKPESVILSNPISSKEIVNVFATEDSKLVDILRKIHASISVHHRTTPFIEHLTRANGAQGKMKCAISITNRFVDIGLANNNKLEFINSFAYQTPEDAIYYILNVAEHFGLNAKKSEFYFSADADNHDAIFELIDKYINHVKFTKPNKQHVYSYMFDESHLTRFTNLFNLSLCE